MLAVSEELERRKRLGWPSSDQDLRSHPDKTFRDTALIKAAREFGVPLPSGEKDRVLDDKLARFGFGKKNIVVPHSIVGRVLIRREYAHSLKLVDLNKDDNYLKFEVSGNKFKLALPPLGASGSGGRDRFGQGQQFLRRYFKLPVID